MRKHIVQRLAVGLGGASVIAAAFFGGRAFAAGIPDDEVLSYAGTLLALDGTPVEGSHDVEVQFSSSASGTPLLCTTTAANTDVVLGRFSVPLDSECVTDVQANSKLYVQVIVDGEEFGWSPIGAVPYAVEAGRARRADDADNADAASSATGALDTRISDLESDVGAILAIPAGAVMAFDLASCPSGWSAYTAANGRTIVGGGTLGGTVGTQLADLEDRSHTHSVNPAAFNSATDGSHAHTVGPWTQFATGLRDLSHTHPFDHKHSWARFNESTLTWTTFASNQGGSATVPSISLVTWGNGFDASGIDNNYPLEPANPNSGNNDYYTGSPLSPSSSAVTLNSGAASANMSHSHTVNVPALTTAIGGAHNHSIDVPATTSAGATTGNVMPYLQLRYCRKN